VSPRKYKLPDNGGAIGSWNCGTTHSTRYVPAGIEAPLVTLTFIAVRVVTVARSLNTSLPPKVVPTSFVMSVKVPPTPAKGTQIL